MTFKAVLFDLGGTLIQTAEIPEIFMRILETYGVKIDSNRVLEAYAANEQEFSVEDGQIELGDAFWSQYDLKLLRRLGIEDNAEYLSKKVDELWWDYADLQFYHDVIDTLTQLKIKQIKTGIVTNALKKDYERILQKLRGASFSDVVVGIDACKEAKPDRGIFLYAVKKLQAKPAEVIFIGDSIEKDYVGAKGAGLKPLLVNRKGEAPENVDSIKSLTDVLLYL